MFGEEYICTFDVSVEDVHFVEDFESVQHLNGHLPNLSFGDVFLPFLVGLDEAGEISP